MEESLKLMILGENGKPTALLFRQKFLFCGTFFKWFNEVQSGMAGEAQPLSSLWKIKIKNDLNDHVYSRRKSD